MEGNLQTLIDERDMQNQVFGYARCVDRCDWSGLRKLFADIFDRDYASLTGLPVERITPEQHIAECVAVLPGLDSTQHGLSNVHIESDGITAYVSAYVTADHTLTLDDGDAQYTLKGIYTFGLAKNDGVWKITSLKLDVLSRQGDPSILSEGAQRVARFDGTTRSSLRG